MILSRMTDKYDMLMRLAIVGGRTSLGLGLGVVLSMLALAVAWGLYIFVGASERSTFMIMSMAGAGLGAGVAANVAWIRLDRQQRSVFALTLLLAIVGGVVGGLVGYQFGANREIECCAEPRTTPFTYTAFGSTVGANAAMYLVWGALAATRLVRGGRDTVTQGP